MSINVNNASQIASLYQTALEQSGVDNVSVTASEDGKSLTISTLDANGSVVGSTTISNVPDIDVPAGGSIGDSEVLASVVAQLGDVVQSLGNLDEKAIGEVEDTFKKLLASEEAKKAGESTSSGGTKEVSFLYDIYQLMSLMLEVAREQREIAREQRIADNQMIINEMEAQRKTMISNAILGMALSIGVAVTQFGMNRASQIKSNKVTAMRQNDKLLSGQNSYNNINNMTGKVSTPAGKEMVISQSETKLQAAADTYASNAKLSESELGQVQNGKTSIDEQFKAVDEMDAAKYQEATGAKEPPTDKELADYKAAERSKIYEEAKAERETAREEFLVSAKSGKPDPVARQKLEYANAKLEYTAARYLQNATPTEKAAFKTVAQADLKESMQFGGGLDIEIAAKQHSNQLFDSNAQAIGGMLQGMVNSSHGILDAQVKKMDQAIELDREQRDTTRDLVSTAMEMFKQMLSVLNSIIETERSSFREIMG